MRKLLFFIGGCLLTTWLGAQELKLVQTNVPQTVPFAQPFTVQYTFAHPAGYQTVWDKTALSQNFAVRPPQITPRSPDSTTFDFTVIPFTLGKSTFTLSFQLKQNNTLLATQSFSLPLEITPVKTFDDKEIREIRPPFPVRNWMWLLALLALAALIYAIYLWGKHHQAIRNLQISSQEDTRPSHVIALSKIEGLLQSGLWENEQYKIFYITLVDILREYLRRRFQLDVSAETSSELIAHIKTKAELKTFVTALRELLNASDLIKFAKAVPNEQQRNQHIEILRMFVQQTTPAPSPEKEVTK